MSGPVVAYDCCLLCYFVFWDKKRKRNITGEFAKIFEDVFGHKACDSGGQPRAVCDSCRYKIVKAWKEKKSSEESNAATAQHALKRKHPISPLSSSKGDVETERRIERKKGHRLAFESVCLQNITPKPFPVASRLGVKEISTTQDASSQTSKSSCQCLPSTTKKTCVKVCMVCHRQNRINLSLLVPKVCLLFGPFITVCR